MKKIFIFPFLITLLFGAQTKAEKIPTGYNSWYFADDPSKHALAFGDEPENYWNGQSWIASDPRFIKSSNGYRSIKNRHFVFVDTLNDIVRFAISDFDGNIHIFKTRIGPLFLYNGVTSDKLLLASPNLSGYIFSDDKIIIPKVYPGVSCYIWNKRTGLEQRFVFSPEADSMIDMRWRNANSDSNLFLVNAVELIIDSLNFRFVDEKGLFEPTQSHEINGDIDLFAESGSHILTMSQGFVNQDTLRAPLYRQTHRSGSRVWLYEGFRIADLAAWPQKGYWHNDSRTWQTSGVDTYISASEPGSSYYSSAVLTAYRDVTLGVRQRGLIWFQGLIDSLRNAATVDSALMQLHYCGDLFANGTLRISRGIADSTWYNSGHATWNAKYKLGNDSLKWVGGWATHINSYTLTNSVSLNLADTNSTGWYRFSCKNLINDIKSNGTDWGIWVDNGFGSTTQRASFDSAENASKAPRLYFEYRLGGARSRKLKLEE